MKKKIMLSILLLISLLMIVGCKADKENTNNDDNANNNTSSSENEEVENTDDTQSDDSKTEREFSDAVLRLGEAGDFGSSRKEFSITPTAFEIISKEDSLNGMTSEYEDGVYLVLDLTVKNTGEENIKKIDYISNVNYYLLNDNHEGKLSFPHPDNEADWQRVLDVERFEKDEEIEPGQEITGQLIFETTPAENYAIGFGDLSANNQNEVTWYIDIEEATSVADDFNIASESNSPLTLEETATIHYIQGMGVTDIVEITPTAITVLDTLETESGTVEPNRMDEKIVLIDITVKNNGEEDLDENVVIGSESSQPVILINDNENRRVSFSEGEFAKGDSTLTEPIKPGEEVKGQIYFQAPEAASYDLLYGSVYHVLYENKEAMWHLNVN